MEYPTDLTKGCSEKEKRCIREVKGKVNPYVVCNASVGKQLDSIEAKLEKLSEHVKSEKERYRRAAEKHQKEVEEEKKKKKGLDLWN